MNRDLRELAIILSPNSPRFERLFWQPKIGSFEGHFGFLARNDGNHVQNIANIVWIVIYAFSRSFWAQTRLGWGEFFVGQKLASIWETFLAAQNWLLRGPFWVFGPKRWKSCTNHGYYCMNRDLRLLAIILSSNSTCFERIFWRPKICSLEGLLCFWPETLEIMYKTLQILYESWSTRFRNH